MNFFTSLFTILSTTCFLSGCSLNTKSNMSLDHSVAIKTVKKNLPLIIKYLEECDYENLSKYMRITDKKDFHTTTAFNFKEKIYVTSKDVLKNILETKNLNKYINLLKENKKDVFYAQNGIGVASGILWFDEAGKEIISLNIIE